MVTQPDAVATRPVSSSSTATSRADSALDSADRSSVSYTKEKDLEKHNDEEKPYKPTCLGFLRTYWILHPCYIWTALTALVVLVILVIIVPVYTVTKHKHRSHIYHDLTHISPVREAVGDNFADPSLLNVAGKWYAFATNNAAGVLPFPPGISRTAISQPNLGVANIQMAMSTDFKNWTLNPASSDPLPTVGAWAANTRTTTAPYLAVANVWAPAVLQRPSDNKFVMYYSASLPIPQNRFHCVGAAISATDNPAGPYTPIDGTIACPINEGGAIDPAAFIDVDQRVYVAWKVDGNSIGNGGACGNTVAPQVNTPIMMQPMKDDGVTALGEPKILLNRTDSDGPLVEAPAFVRSADGVYFMFFSSGCTRENTYDIKYAWAHNITGPYTRATFPLVQSGDWGLMAPGSCDVIPDPDGGAFALAFHARVWNEYGGIRVMFTSKLHLNGTAASLLAQPVARNATVFAGTQLSLPESLPANTSFIAANSTAGDSGTGSVDQLGPFNQVMPENSTNIVSNSLISLISTPSSSSMDASRTKSSSSTSAETSRV